MSAARVLNPAVLTDLCKMTYSPNISRRLPCGQQINRIKRDLFGQNNSVETNKLFTEEMEKHQEKAIKKWGFDFRRGLPVATNSQFIWEPITQKESNFAPEVYTLTRAAHVRPELDEPTSMELMMDERSERENSFETSLDTDSCDESQDESASIVVFKAPAPSTITLRSLRSHSNPDGPSTSAAAGLQKTPMTTRTSTICLRKRQPRITEFMKERKRLAQTPKKLSPPSKRARTSSGSSGSSNMPTPPFAITPSNAHSISRHFQFRTVQNYK